MTVKLLQGDCLELMKDIPDGSVDMILADLPYGTTACKWDTIIPFEALWAEYERVIKGNGAIVLTAAQPFTSALVMSNPGLFRYEVIWEKDKGVDFGNANRKILNAHESVLFFYKKQPVYNRQDFPGAPYVKRNNNTETGHNLNFSGNKGGVWENKGTRAPKSVLKFNRVSAGGQRPLHPTQKPEELFEFLIKTYTNEGETVLDNVMGSGTTGVACKNLNRNFIGMELDEEYFKIATERINEVGE